MTSSPPKPVEPGGAGAGKHPAPSRFRRILQRFSAVEMLIALVLLFVATPFIEGLPGGEPIETTLWTIFLVSAVLAVGGRRGTLLLSTLLVTPALIGKWLNHFQPQSFSPALFLVGALVFCTFIIVNILRFVLTARRITTEVLCASVTAYLMFGMTWGMAYRLTGLINPAAFTFNVGTAVNEPLNGFTAFYFSFVTLTTLGYGDIIPMSSVARMLAVMESMTGTLYVAILIARLVSIYSTPPPADPADQSSS